MQPALQHPHPPPGVARTSGANSAYDDVADAADAVVAVAAVSAVSVQSSASSSAVVRDDAWRV